MNRVVVSQAAVTRAVERQPESRRALEQTAEAIAQQVVRLSPVGNPRYSKRPGYFKRRTRMRAYKTWFRVENTDRFAHLIEWGSINNPPYAPFRNAVESLGLKLHEAAKPEKKAAE